MRFVAAMGAVLSLLFSSALAQPGISPGAAPASFSVRLSSSRLTVAGHASSRAHESILRDTARRFFGDRSIRRTEFDLSVATTPPGWALVTDMTLRALSTARTASAEVTPGRVHIRGVAEDSDEWQESVSRLGSTLLEGMQLELDMIVVSPRTSYADACQQQMLEVSQSRQIEFAPTKAELRSSAMPQLDAVIELAAECPNFELRVIGHTDATGSEAENVALSRARAAAVVAYLASRGVPPKRLSAIGAGSSTPLVEGNNRRARRLNRRVEFQLRQP